MEVILYLLVYSPPWVSCQWEAWQSTKCRCQAQSFGFRHWLKLSSSDNRDAPCRSSGPHPLESETCPFIWKNCLCPGSTDIPWHKRVFLSLCLKVWHPLHFQFGRKWCYVVDRLHLHFPYSLQEIWKGKEQNLLRTSTSIIFFLKKTASE